MITTGYHHGEEFDDRTHMTLVYGLVVGFGLASMFLILLCITYCYVRNNPNRGQRASAREKSKNLGTPMCMYSDSLPYYNIYSKDSHTSASQQVFHYNETCLKPPLRKEKNALDFQDRFDLH